MKTKRTYFKIAAATTAFAVVAGGLTIWSVTGADAAVRERVERLRVASETRETLRALLTEEQKEVLEAFRAESKEIRAERRDLLEEQRGLLAGFQLTPRQWEQLSVVIDTHGQTVIDAAMAVADSRVALRDAVLAVDGTEEAMRAAAASAKIVQ